MLRIVCYDITNPKRLTKIAKVCLEYGIRLQKSCFQVDVEDKERYRRLIAAIESIMDRKHDSLIIYAICDDCSHMAISLGPSSIIDPDKVVFL